VINPNTAIEGGVDIHTLFEFKDLKRCTQIYDNFLSFLKENNIPFEKNRIFERPVGPWPTPMWQLVLKGENFYSDLGKAISWLFLNRGEFSVMIHPNTSDELLDHTERTIWLGKSYELKLEIFS
jgi:DOPA 4,5-dioxygenase